MGFTWNAVLLFNLEKTFKTTFSLLVLHIWLCLCRLKQEGKEGVEFGQYLYERYNHDVELRLSEAGVNLSKLETKCRAMTLVGKAIEARAPLMNLIRLKGVPILEQLHLEEQLLRTSLDNWCLINDGTNSPAIVMGLSGKLSELVEVRSVLQDQIPVIRRFSGGGTVIVDQGTIFVTLICNKDAVPDIQPFPRSIMSWSGQLYSEVFDGIGDFRLRENDYVFGDCKFGGNAQSIIKHRWIHHTSFLWDYEVKNMGYLKLPAKAPNYRLARGHTDFVCRMKEFLPRSEFVQRTIEAIRSRFSLEPVAENIADIDVPSTTHFAPSTKLLTDHDMREVSAASL